MTFFVRKLVEALLLPLGFGILLVLAGLVFRRRLWSLLGIAVICIASIPAVGVALMTPLEARWPERSIAACPEADAVVMLSGGIVRGISAHGIQWGNASNRFFTAINLTLAGKGRFLVLTNDHVEAGQTDSLHAEAIRRGIPEERILLTGPVLTTEDEARAVAALPGIHHIVLVTSAAHMPRSKMLFSAFGLQVEPFPTDLHHFHKHDLNPQNFVPTAGGYVETEGALREYYGLAAYWLLLTLHPPKLPAVSASVPAVVSVPR